MEVFTKRVKFFPESQFFVLKLRWAFLRLGFYFGNQTDWSNA